MKSARGRGSGGVGFMGGSKAVLGAARSLGGESGVACEDVVRHLNLNKLENIYNIGGRGGGCVVDRNEGV